MSTVGCPVSETSHSVCFPVMIRPLLPEKCCQPPSHQLGREAPLHRPFFLHMAVSIQSVGLYNDVAGASTFNLRTVESFNVL